MQYFQPILIILGILAILAVLIHGYMVSHKNNSTVSDEALDSQGLASYEAETNQQSDTLDVQFDKDEQQNYDFDFSSKEDDIQDLHFSVESDLNEKPDIDLQPEVEAVAPEPELKEPVDDLVDEKKSDSSPEDYFVFNVAAKEGNIVRGHELLQFFLTAGFRFGEFSIFHRHENADGTGPVLFSIANMMEPGIFDVDNMEQFSSQGVTFFLAAPNDKINVRGAFDLMLHAVEQMAEEFDCIVLNEARELLTEAQFRNYHERLSRYS